MAQKALGFHYGRMVKKGRPHAEGLGSLLYVREWREYRGLNQAQLVGRLEMSGGTISQLENGKQFASQATLIGLARAFDCEVGDLYRDPTRPDYQLWREFMGMREDQKVQALKVIRALKESAA